MSGTARKFALAALSTAAFAVGATEPAVGHQQEELAAWQDGKLKVTLEDYYAAIAGKPIAQRRAISDSPKNITKLLEEIQIFRSIAAAARGRGLDRDPVLKRSVELEAERLLAMKYLESGAYLDPRPDFTKAARERYEIQKAKYAQPERVRVMHVLVNEKTRNDAEARARIDEVRAKALAGADFTQLAKDYSDDPSVKKNNGDMGFFGRGQMVKPFENASFALVDPGQISEVVKTDFGYHVIKFIDREVVRQLSFEEVRDKLVQEEELAWKNDQRARYFAEIRGDKSLRMNTDAIDALIKAETAGSTPVSDAPK